MEGKIMGSLPITVLIVDDEKPARDELAYIIGQDRSFKIVGEADSGEDALELVDKLEPDVVFLDIEMNGINGLEVARRVCAKENHPAVIFATAYNQHAIKAFEVRAIDYVLKPFDDERVGESLERLKMLKEKDGATEELVVKIADLLTKGPLKKAAKQLEDKQGITRISVEHNGRLLLIDPKDIIFVATGLEKQITIHTKSGVYPAKMNLSTLEEKLSKAPGDFFRVQRSFLINLDEVKELIPWFKGNYMVVMSDRNKTEIPVSRLNVKELKERLGLI
jgi:two-component system LytT family response regulator/two-component system response regulator LytT